MERGDMPGNPHEMITMAERRFPVRIRIAIPPGGLDKRHGRITAWLDENCGADCWTMTPSSGLGVFHPRAREETPESRAGSWRKTTQKIGVSSASCGGKNA